MLTWCEDRTGCCPVADMPAMTCEVDPRVEPNHRLACLNNIHAGECNAYSLFCQTKLLGFFSPLQVAETMKS